MYARAETDLFLEADQPIQRRRLLGLHLSIYKNTDS